MNVLITLLALTQAGNAAPPQQAPARTPVAPPEAALLREAEKQIKDTFKDEYALRSPDDKKALAGKLLNVGRQSDDAPAMQYVLLVQAAELSVEAGDPLTITTAYDELGDRFTVDTLSMKSDGLKDVVRYARTPETVTALVDACLATVDQAVQADEFSAARTLMSRAEAAARKTRDAGVVAMVKEKKDAVKAVEAAYRPVKSALKTLESDPSDADANLEVGLYFCLFKDDWKTGTFLLTQGADETYRALADQELAPPTASAGQLALGDGWWDVSEKERNKETKRRLQGRAVHWYEAGIAAAAGLDRIRVEQRIEEYYSVGGVTRYACIDKKSMDPFPVGHQQGAFPKQDTDDPTGPFRKEPVYYQQRTGQEIHFEVQSAYPVRQVYWKGAAMLNLTIEVQDHRGNILASGGPFGGGNTWGEFTVDMPPRTRFILVIKNYISTWLFIDTIELRR